MADLESSTPGNIKFGMQSKEQKFIFPNTSQYVCRAGEHKPGPRAWGRLGLSIKEWRRRNAGASGVSGGSNDNDMSPLATDKSGTF